MSSKVIVNGAKGRMGSETVRTIESSDTLELVAALDKGDNLAASIQDNQADIVVDFTNAATVYANATAIIEAGAHPVIGATGLLPEQIDKLSALCKEKALGGLIVPNFSIGAVLMMQFARQAAQYFPDVEIIELHHENKQDSPSGTAIKTAEGIADSRLQTPESRPAIETIPGARGALYHNIPIHAVRLPGLVAHQTVLFGGHSETLTLKHDTIARAAFMPGVVLACEKVSELTELNYGLECLL